MSFPRGEAPALIGIAEPQLLVIDNGASRTRYALGAETLQPIEEKTPKVYSTAIDLIAAKAQALSQNGSKYDGIGISIAGSPENGRLVQAGMLQEYGWVGKPLAEDLAAALNLEIGKVVILNDCVAAANGERTARPDTIGVLWAQSTGFNTARWTPDETFGDETGHNFLRNGAMCGCGKEGCIEAFVSGSGLEKNLGLRGEKIKSGDPIWTAVTNDTVEGMDLILSRYTSELGFKPEVISAIGSVVTSENGQIFPNVRTGLQRLGYTAAIELAIYGEYSGMYGALAAAQDRVHAA